MLSSKKGLTSQKGLKSFKGLRSFRGLRNAMFDPAKLFLPGDKGVFFVQNQATMWSDFARTTPTVRNGGDPSGLVAVIDNMVDTGGTIESPSSAARPELISDGVSFTYNVDSFTVDFGTGVQETGSVVVASNKGVWFGEFESESNGTMLSLFDKLNGATGDRIVGLFIINRTITLEQKQLIKTYFNNNGASVSTSASVQSLARQWYLTKFDVEALPFIDLSVSNYGTTWFANNLDANSINNILLYLHANRKGRTGVIMINAFSAGTNAPWASLSTEAQNAVIDLETNYSWNFTNAFRGRFS